jgi:hypothetical protein
MKRFHVAVMQLFFLLKTLFFRNMISNLLENKYKLMKFMYHVMWHGLCRYIPEIKINYLEVIYNGFNDR